MTNNKTRVFGLDLMRAMAIAMVLCSHILWIYNPKDEIIKQFFSLFVKYSDFERNKKHLYIKSSRINKSSSFCNLDFLIVFTSFRHSKWIRWHLR